MKLTGDRSPEAPNPEIDVAGPRNAELAADVHLPGAGMDTLAASQAIAEKLMKGRPA